MDHSCDLGVDGCEGVDLIQLLQDGVHWRSVLNSLSLKGAVFYDQLSEDQHLRDSAAQS